MSKHLSSLAVFKCPRLKPSCFPIVVIATIVSLSASAWTWLVPATKAERIVSPSEAEIITTASPQSGSTQEERVEAEVITIRPTGFEPGEIVRPKGRVLLVINNSAGLGEVVLQLERESGAKIQRVRASRRKQNFRKVIEFTPGSYTLTEANHPGWVCRITITD